MYFNYAKLNLLQSRGCGGMLPQESFNVLGYKICHSELGGLHEDQLSSDLNQMTVCLQSS